MLFKIIITIALLIAPQQQVADRVVAVVNGDPILLSELYASAVGTGEEEVEEGRFLQNRLEQLINQTLILQELRRLKIFSVSTEEIDIAENRLIQAAGSMEAYQADLFNKGINRTEQRAAITRSILISRFIDYRFRRIVSIEEERIHSYYLETFTADFQTENPGAEVPEYETVSESIEALLTERLVNEELQRWLTDARAQARIVIKF